MLSKTLLSHHVHMRQRRWPLDTSRLIAILFNLPKMKVSGMINIFKIGSAPRVPRCGWDVLRADGLPQNVSPYTERGRELQGEQGAPG